MFQLSTVMKMISDGEKNSSCGCQNVVVAFFFWFYGLNWNVQKVYFIN